MMNLFMGYINGGLKTLVKINFFNWDWSTFSRSHTWVY